MGSVTSFLILAHALSPFMRVSSRHMKMETAVEIDWSITDRLYEKGYIHDPVGKSKSVVLTEEGLAKSEELFKKLFVKSE